ncbi:hypothetical protein GQX73_g532 [Xylaria multiplex]|uniref:Mid2 domain-containing protein n=1 Tax=Xylaria multiplex TaxID=323545 RepID=A0A7C8MW69_9PEZI|nr:hypothetical protein GQX73_g532 [Xylaria multiplex]
MRLTAPPPALIALLFTTLTAAVPYPRDSLRDNGFGYLKPQECSEYCGAENELCCSADEACYTSAGTPTCTGLTHLLAERDYTTTWTETHTYTSTISSWYVPTTTAGVGSDGAPCVPPEGSGQIACGKICCANWQYCAYDNQCLANPGYSTYTEVVTTGVYVTTQFSAPYRPTSGPSATQSSPTGTFVSATESASSTSTSPAAVSTADNSLSGGAIAGIVVGTIAGVILLLLLCFCCIARGLWHVVAGIFGGGKKKRGSERIEVTEERYSRHGSAAAARPTHRTWFGGGGGRPSTASRKEKKSGSGLGWLVAAIGAIALLLGLRRGDKRKSNSHRPSRSDWSSSYYSDSYTATSPSEFTLPHKFPTRTSY